MKSYDLIVVGSGAGMIVVEEALTHELRVALVDRGPLGGTCLNVGCIPSKMLIYPADMIARIQEAGKLGIEAAVKNIDFAAIMERMHRSIHETRTQMRQGIEQTKGLDYYEKQAHFITDYILQAGDEQITADKIVLASGSRPLIPDIPGLDRVPYLTNESLLELKRAPESLTIIGGGYIAAEYGHFFAAMGTRVTILEMGDRLVPSEEPEISRLLKESLSRRMEVYTNTHAVDIGPQDNSVAVRTIDRVTNVERLFVAEKVLVATGRRSNADLLHVESSGIETDSRGFIKVNRYLETNRSGIWAIGDAIGKYMFTHVANREASIVVDNIVHRQHSPMDYGSAPHAIFSHPQIASVGLGEEEARQHHELLVGTAMYSDVAKGEAMMEEEGFAKAIVDRGSARLLGFHIIGPHAAILIQEVVNAMASGGKTDAIAAGMHIHPALPELVVRTLGNLEER